MHVSWAVSEQEGAPSRPLQCTHTGTACPLSPASTHPQQRHTGEIALEVLSALQLALLALRLRRLLLLLLRLLCRRCGRRRRGSLLSLLARLLLLSFWLSLLFTLCSTLLLVARPCCCCCRLWRGKRLPHLLQVLLHAIAQRGAHSQRLLLRHLACGHGGGTEGVNERTAPSVGVQPQATAG